jgi:hypothetical protein
MSKARKEFYAGKDDDKGPRPNLRVCRKKIPLAMGRMLQREQTEDVIEWIQIAQYWIEKRSKGYANWTVLPRDEIKKRKLEGGKILRDFNIYFSDGDPIKF